MNITATPQAGSVGIILFGRALRSTDPGDVATFSAAVSGTYTVVATDSTRLHVPARSGTLTVNPSPTVTVNSPTECINALPATMTANPSGGTGPYHYVWTVPSGATNPGDVDRFSATVEGSYSVVVSDSSTSCMSAPGSGC